MTNEALQELIGSWFPNPDFQESPVSPEPPEIDENEEGTPEEQPPVNPSLLEFTEEGSEFLNIQVQPAHLHELMHRLKTDKATHFDYLFCLTGVDWGEELGVVYHLESTSHRHIVVLKVKTADRETPTLDTVSDIWRTAEFHEREVYDFFGITVTGHPNLKRLFMTPEWEGWPLRKDYVDEKNMVIK